LLRFKPVSSMLLLFCVYTTLHYMTAGRIARKLWWTNQEFSLYISFHHGAPYSYITWEINNRPSGGRNSETYSHPIDIIIMMICPKIKNNWWYGTTWRVCLFLCQISLFPSSAQGSCSDPIRPRCLPCSKILLFFRVRIK
jgi:hypothetical protein